jgi:hypothetical protein
MHKGDKTVNTRNNRLLAGLIILIILLIALAGYFFFTHDEKPVPVITASITPAPASAAPEPLPATPEPPPVTPEPLSATSEPPPATSEPLPVTPGPQPVTYGPLPVSPGPPPITPGPLSAAPEPSLPPPSSPAAPEPPPILHPIEPVLLDQPLPELESSDTPFQAALGEIIGIKGLPLILSEELIHRLVVTIDNLPRKYLPARVVPLRRAKNAFVTEGKDENMAISAHNAKRYAVYIAAAKTIDSAKLVEVYRRYYPLFQSAYQEIGYPKANFNDRLVVAIDDLLAAPNPGAPIWLAQPKVLFEYADPKLENRSSGQKIMMRIGQENAAVIKAKLGEIRQRVASGAAP